MLPLHILNERLILCFIHIRGNNFTQDGFSFCIPETQRIYIGPTLMELQESTKCVSSDIIDGPIQRFVKIKFYKNVESSSEEFAMSYPILSFLCGDGS